MKKKTVRRIAVFVVLLSIFVVYVWRSANSLIVDAGGEYFAFSVSNCSYAAIDECTKSGQFEGLCAIGKDDAGKVAYVSTDVLALNVLSVKLASDCYDRLEALCNDGFFVPCGVFTGIRLLAGQGRKVRVKYVTVLSVQCDMVRSFEACGINQSHLTLTAVIHANVALYTPLGKNEYDEKIEVPVYDNFIIGEVPEVFFNSEVVGSWKK